jgi:adenine/guanine phosphoribosyltransferase-like PRPP-binding protein
MPGMSVGAGYATKLKDLPSLADQILKDLTPHAKEFDTIVATGTSGMMIAPIIAVRMGKNLVAVRKPDEQSHSYDRLQGTFGKRWIFLDDFVASGSTLRRVIRAVNDEGPPAKFVGVYLYEVEKWNRFRPPSKFDREINPPTYNW